MSCFLPNRFQFTHFCEWYRQDRNNIDRSRIVYESAPASTFMAKVVREFQSDGNEIGGNFYVDGTTVVVATYDSTEGMKVNDRVVMEGRTFLVQSVSRMPYRPNTLYCDDPVIRTTITMTGK